MIIVACAQCGTKNRVDEELKLKPVCGKCGASLETSGAGAEEQRTQTVTDSTFARDCLQAGSVPVLLDCWAEWCGPCRMIAPVLDQLAAEAEGRYRIAKLNVDENPQTAAQLGIQSIPALLIFKNGKLVDRLVGAQPKQAIKSRLEAHV